jgi:ribosomal protein S14
MPKQEFVCSYCGRRVFAERGPLTALKLCRSCFEKARAAQRPAPDPKESPPRNPSSTG